MRTWGGPALNLSATAAAGRAVALLARAQRTAVVRP
jgi:hypothetical protein